MDEEYRVLHLLGALLDLLHLLLGKRPAAGLLLCQVAQLHNLGVLGRHNAGEQGNGGIEGWVDAEAIVAFQA